MMLEVDRPSISEDWNLEKRGKFILNVLASSILFILIPFQVNDATETLLLIGQPWLVVCSVIYGLLFSIFLEVFGRYEVESCKYKISHLILTFCAALIAIILIILGVWLIKYEFIGRYIVGYILLSTGFISFITSIIVHKLATLKKPSALLLVADQSAERIKNEALKLGLSFNWYTKAEENDGSFNYVIVESPIKLSDAKIMHFVSSGAKILPVSQFWCEIFRNLPLESVDQDWLVGLDLDLRNPFNKRIKRLIDLFLSLFSLLLFVPLLIVAAILVLVESGLPIFFSQTRSGFMGNQYTMYKIRTMRQKSELSGPQWADKDDKRVTRVGSILRKWRIDEIPQLWNVLKGEMSLVGPRPERPEFDEILYKKIPYWKWRLMVKPGLTGWAQIRSNYASDEESSKSKLSHDLYYIKYASLLLDMEIILSTLRSIKKGSR